MRDGTATAGGGAASARPTGSEGERAAREHGGHSKKSIYTALVANLAIAVTKFVAAALTGSSAMLSEGVHSVVDTLNEGVILLGIARSKKPPDSAHPLGHGRELYFWSFVVGMLVFVLGAGISIREGIHQVAEPTPIEDPLVAYVVLGLAMCFEGWSWLVAWRQFRAAKGQKDAYEAIVESKDPTSFLVLVEDSAALLGLLFAFAGTFGSEQLDLPVLDGCASLAIGLLLGLAAFLIARESKALLIGERAGPELERSILEIARATPLVRDADRLYTVHLGPHQVVAMLSLRFDDDLEARELREAVAEVERRVRAAHGEVRALFVRPRGAGQGRT
jgi:cation diffusion facilitator family transporter